MGFYLMRFSSVLMIPLSVALTLTHLPARGQHGGPGAFPGHTLGVFIGDTSEDSLNREGLTLGLEYEYRVSEGFGLGLTAEHIGGDFDTGVFVLPAAFHSGPWKFYTGPGIEFHSGERESLLRVGVEYGFHFKNYEISPQVDFDFVDGERLFVIGLVIAREL